MSRWKTSPLASICTVFGDGDWIESKDQSPEGVRLVQTGNVGEGEFKDRAEKARFISEATFSRLRCTEIFAGDCLISRLPDPVGRACLIPEMGERMITAVDCTIVRFDQSKLLPEFFAYYSQAGDYLAAVEREATGTTRKRISRARLGLIPVPLAPLPEQRRIVAILDEAFEGIATAKANAEKNLQNARELFTSHLERVFGQRGADWHEAPLLSFASAISTGPFGSLLHKSDYVSDGVPLVNPINIVDGLIVPDPDKLIDSTTKQRLQSYVLREGDIVVGRRGEIGRCAVVGPNEAGWVCGTGCFFVRPLPTVRSAFIAHLIRSREYRARLEHASTGATMKNLSNTALGELHVAVPPIAEQDRALALIGRLAEDCGRLEDVYERKLAALDELKKSLLHQAFTGALTAKSIDKQVAEVA
ncbi:MAG: restriction endonuclease subunit S [Alphaproteobacteria bacterium]